MSDVTTSRAKHLYSRFPLSPQWEFFLWGAGSYLVITFFYLEKIYSETNHHLVYLLDDAAIHLTIARDLAYHFTWGITPGHYQSASSSPVWTVLLAGLIRVVPWAATWTPLVLTIASSLGLIFVIGASQTFLKPHWSRPLHVIAAVLIVNVVLFLPALTLLGMEHTLHMLLIVGVMILVCSRIEGKPTFGPRWLLYAALAVGELVRFETIFVALGIAVALVLTALLPTKGTGSRAELMANNGRLSAAIVVATGFPLLVYMAFNRMMGGGWLPNSLLARANGLGASGNVSFANLIHELAKDRLFLALLVAVCALLCFGLWRGASYVVPAAATVIAMLLQATFAQIGQYDRYQAYLIALGVFTILKASPDVLSLVVRVNLKVPVVAALALLVCTVVVAEGRIQLTEKIPRASADVYDQKYLAGEFLHRYYNDQPVASGELGWISWLHQGAFTDLLGLGDYDVLTELRATQGLATPEYWYRLGIARRITVVVMYPETTAGQTPRQWIYVGEWRLNRPTVTALSRVFQFWATTPSEVQPLEVQLMAFSKNLPRAEKLIISPLATIRARQLQ